LTDVQEKKFYAFERFSRGSNQLAGAQSKPFQVWLEDWKVASIQKEMTIPFPNIKIQAAQNGISIDLDLQNTKPVVLHGDWGLSQKGAEPGNASYYYSLTRMIAGGQIIVNDDTFKVTGLAWLDREWSTRALGKDQGGWDWFSLQLDNGREIMYYQIRKRDGQLDKYSSGTLIQMNGASRHLNSEDISIEVLAYWISPRGGKYPSQWRLEIPSEKLNLEITPYLQEQELNFAIRYWEGAVKSEGLSNGEKIQGNGYVELTGYGDLTNFNPKN
jgi:predicted secreted hydrolase